MTHWCVILHCGLTSINLTKNPQGLRMEAFDMIIGTLCKLHEYDYGHAWVNRSLPDWLNQNSVNYNKL